MSVAKTLPTSASGSPLRVRPQGSLTVPDAVVFDADGRRLPPSSLVLSPRKVQISSFLVPGGKEGLLGAEAGVMAFGLTGDSSTTGGSLTQVGAVLGIGLAITLANASQANQASIRASSNAA